MNSAPKAIITELGAVCWFHYHELDSTQTRARELLNNTAGSFIVTAATQKLGHGRSEHTWESPEGNLYLTAAWQYNDLAPLSLIELAVLTALYLSAAYNLDIKLKWPNDIVVNEQKLSGMIGELTYKNELPYALLGIGININREPLGPVRYKATSLQRLLGKYLDINDFRYNFCHYLAQNLPHKSNAPLLRERYLALSATIGQNVSFMCGDEEITGEAKTIDDNFSLVVKTNAGEVRSFSSGDCRHLRKAE